MIVTVEAEIGRLQLKKIMVDTFQDFAPCWPFSDPDGYALTSWFWLTIAVG